MSGVHRRGITWVPSIYLLIASRSVVPLANRRAVVITSHSAKAFGRYCAPPGRRPEALRGPRGHVPETTRGCSCLLGAFSFCCFFSPSFLTCTYESVLCLLCVGTKMTSEVDDSCCWPPRMVPSDPYARHFHHLREEMV